MPYLNIPKTKPLSESSKSANKADIAETFKTDERPLMDRLGDAWTGFASSTKRSLAEEMAKRKAQASKK